MAFEHYSDADKSQLILLKPQSDAIKTDLDGTIKDVIYNGSKIYALHGDKISVLDEELSLIAEHPISANVQEIAVSGDMAYLLKPTLIEAFSLN